VNISIPAETTPWGTVVRLLHSDSTGKLDIPIQQGSWKIGSKTDPIVTTFSAHNPIHGGITVLQSQDWLEGGSSKGLIKGSVEQKRRKKAKNPEIE
jgi:hypothetical protein